jgi:integrase
MATIQRRPERPDKPWRVRYRDPSGVQRSRSFRRKPDAERFLVQNENAKLEGQWRDPAAGKVLFGVQAKAWLATKAGRAPTYQRDLRMLLEHQLYPTFRNAPLMAIDTMVVETWLAKLATTGLSPKRQREALAVLRQMLKSAGFTVTVKPPKAQGREMLCLSAEQVEALATAITPPYGTLVRFMSWSGLRPEKTTALRVRHYDQLHGTIRVAEAAPLLEGVLVFGDVKTHEARTIHLPGFLRLELDSYLETRGDLGPDDFIFTMPRGGPMRENRWVADHLKPAVRRAGLDKRLRAYDLRHTAASLAIRAGANVLTVSKMLGHSNPSITLDRYSHLFGDELEALAKVLDAAHAAASGPDVAPAVVPLRETTGQEA